VSVRVYDLAEILRNRSRIDLIRMDVEGHEIEILESLTVHVRTFPEKAPRRIIFETHEYGGRGPRMHAAMTAVVGAGYRVRYLTSDDEIRPEGSVIRGRGYRPIVVLHEWGYDRGVYEQVATPEAVELIASWRGTRTVLLEYGENGNG
jgi:hypothetical protein